MRKVKARDLSSTLAVVKDDEIVRVLAAVTVPNVEDVFTTQVTLADSTKVVVPPETEFDCVGWVPTERDSRNCFAIEWYDSEQRADQVAAEVVARGERVNGGAYHGTLCGRDPSFDAFDVDGSTLYAVMRQ